jgi:hypothetical protein
MTNFTIFLGLIFSVKENLQMTEKDYDERKPGGMHYFNVPVNFGIPGIL